MDNPWYPTYLASSSRDEVVGKSEEQGEPVTVRSLPSLENVNPPVAMSNDRMRVINGSRHRYQLQRRVKGHCRWLVRRPGEYGLREGMDCQTEAAARVLLCGVSAVDNDDNASRCDGQAHQDDDAAENDLHHGNLLAPCGTQILGTVKL